MRAAVYLDREVVGLSEHDVPEPPPGWVRIGVTSAGICGSDLHVFHAALGDPTGWRPGHDIAGVVDRAAQPSSSGRRFSVVSPFAVPNVVAASAIMLACNGDATDGSSIPLLAID